MHGLWSATELLFIREYLLIPLQHNKMAEGPDSASQSSQNKSSCEKEQEPAVIDPHVTCGHCKKELNNPYLLCCLHSVCAECLPNMVVENVRLKCSQCGDTSTAWNDGKISESECQVDSVRCFPVPNGPLARYIEGKAIAKVLKESAIPCGNKTCKSANNPSVVYCIECATYLCQHCKESHETMSYIIGVHTMKGLEELRSLRPQEHRLVFSKSNTPNTCPRHKGKVLEYSCEQCNVLMCQACAVDRKSPHTPVFLDDSVSHPHAKAMKIAHQAAVCFGKKCEKIENKFQSQIRTVDDMKEVSLVAINTTFQTIHEAVEKRKEELCRQVITTAEEKKRTIDSNLKSALREKEALSNIQSSLQFLLSSGSSHDVIASKDVVRTHQSVLTSKWCQEELESTVSQVVTFDPTNQDVLLKAIDNFGVVESGACPANCTVEPQPESVQWNYSDPVTLTVTTFDRENIQCKGGGDSVEAFLHPKSPIPGPAIKARVVDDKNGRYTISFPTTYPVECDLYIRVNGRDIRGSPFVINFLPKSCLPKLKNVRELGDNKGYLNYPQQGGGPWGIAVGQNDHIFVADHYKHQIHVFDKHRKYIRSLSKAGSTNGCLEHPTGIAIDIDGLLYIANYNGHRVEVIKEDGTFVRRIGEGHLQNPYGVVIRDKSIYVANAGNHTVAVFTLEGKLVRTVGHHGSGPGQFNWPTAVSFSPNGDMFVIDSQNGRMQVFNPEGLFRREFGNTQISKCRASTITCTADGNMLVGDFGNKKIIVFNTLGNPIHSFQVDGTPCSLCIDYHGDLLVSLHGSVKVAVY